MATPFSDSSLGFVVDSVVANKKDVAGQVFGIAR